MAVPPARLGLPDGAARGHGPAPADPCRVVCRGVALGLLLRPGDGPGGRRAAVRRLAGLAELGSLGPGDGALRLGRPGAGPGVRRRTGRRPAGPAGPGATWTGRGVPAGR